MKIKLNLHSKSGVKSEISDEAGKRLNEVKKLLHQSINETDTFLSSQLPEISQTQKNALENIKKFGDEFLKSVKK